MDILRILYEAHSAEPISGADYFKALDATCQTEKKLLDAHPNIREQFTAFQSAQLNLFSYTAYQEFTAGFRLGAQMMLELLNTSE